MLKHTQSRTEPGHCLQPPHADSLLVPTALPSAQDAPSKQTAQSTMERGCLYCSRLGLTVAEFSSLCLVLLSFFIHSELPAETDTEETNQTEPLSQLLFCSPVTYFPTAQHIVCFMQRLLSFRHETKLSLSAEQYHASFS